MRWSTRSVRAGLAAAALVSLFLCPLAPVAQAQVPDAQAQAKIAPDLLAAISSSTLPAVPWLNSVNGQPLAKVLVASNSTDASLADLRSFVLSLGGSVFYNYASFRMVAVMVPAGHVMDLARRTDVVSVSPNRAVIRASSQLQLTTGAATANASNGTPLDGSGVGIAIVDSGIGYSHQSVSTTLPFNVKGATRVQQALDWVQIGKNLGEAGWAAGTDLSSTIANVLNGTLFTSALQASQLPSAYRADPYGHGTHVASVAAGSGSYQWPDTTGVAPKAALYDMRVLDERGSGNTADVVAGIDWVIQHASSLNIRVMNLSLAAGSTESFLTDPLARAARAASAAGIVVVVAAGNAGKNASGVEVYGAVGSPGHDPSVITVGAVNMHYTTARSDDTVATFSSRGPTRGTATLDDGTAWTDNLLKPDLVAPGNRVVGALSSDVLGTRAGWNQR